MLYKNTLSFLILGIYLEFAKKILKKYRQK